MALENVLTSYAAAAAELIPRFESISSARLYAPVRALLPTRRSRILDVGAGTGRDAAWFASQGHFVTAIEPVQAMRSAGMSLHRCVDRWFDDRLPELGAVRARGSMFDHILMIAVWQHLTEEEREAAMPNLACLVAPGGRILMSLRHGAGAQNRECFAACPDKTARLAEAAGLDVTFRTTAPSVQPANRRAGVSWTWLTLSHR